MPRTSADQWKLFNVFARLARRRSLGLLEWVAFSSFFAGIGSPSGTLRDFLKAPGLLIASAIHPPLA